jgi:hypothetical protein
LCLIGISTLGGNLIAYQPICNESGRSRRGAHIIGWQVPPAVGRMGVRYLRRSAGLGRLIWVETNQSALAFCQSVLRDRRNVAAMDNAIRPL